MSPLSPFQQDAVSAILDPMVPETFFKEYWGQKPIYIRGHAHKFATLFSGSRLWDCLTPFNSPIQSTEGILKEFHVRASFDRGNTLINVAPKDGRKVFDAGATVCVNKINAVEKQLDSILENIKRATHFLGGLDFRAYISPDGQGFDTHFDARIATTLQIEGSKEWTFSREPALDWPHSQITLHALKRGETYKGGSPLRMPSECTYETVVLHPGDVLCLPAGCWHSAAARGYSMALNLAFDPNGGFFSTFAPALKHILLLDSGWRSPLPPTYGCLKNGTDAPDVIHEFYRTRISDLIDVLKEFRDSPDILNVAWEKLISPSESLSAVGELS